MQSKSQTWIHRRTISRLRARAWSWATLRAPHRDILTNWFIAANSGEILSQNYRVSWCWKRKNLSWRKMKWTETLQFKCPTGSLLIEIGPKVFSQFFLALFILWKTLAYRSFGSSRWWHRQNVRCRCQHSSKLRCTTKRCECETHSKNWESHSGQMKSIPVDEQGTFKIILIRRRAGNCELLLSSKQNWRRR